MVGREECGTYHPAGGAAVQAEDPYLLPSEKRMKRFAVSSRLPHLPPGTSILKRRVSFATRWSTEL